MAATPEQAAANLGTQAASLAAESATGFKDLLSNNWKEMLQTGAALVGIMLNVTAQVGDLVESLLKRRCGVKNSSELLPAQEDGYRYANSDPVTGQAAWYDLRVRIDKIKSTEAQRSEPVFPTLTPPDLPPRPAVLRYGAANSRKR